MPQEALVRCTVLYSGRVQGVGFRFTAYRIARQYQVSGFVRNLPDGRVELVAEGRAEQVQTFVSTVQNHMKLSIGRADVVRSPATNEFADFEISYA